ncbi:MAG: hypothetical protein ACRC47_17220 [Shewanella sp.]
MWQQINSIDGMIVRVINGFKALCTQSYSEMNRKRGLQWASSREIPAAPPSTGAINSVGVYYSVIKTGALPIDLKQRQFAFSGYGVQADIFTGPTYTGGTVEPVYNSNDMIPGNFLFQLLSGITLTAEGTKLAPTIYAIGSASQQARGAPNALYGENYILKPNTSYLLKFWSKDTQNQAIAVRIEGYEGLLDVPNEDL